MDSKRDKFLKKTKEKVKEALKSRDMLLAATTRSIDELDKVINVLVERLEDWYAIYYPELHTKDRRKYVQIAFEFDRSNPDPKILGKVMGRERADEAMKKLESCLGADLNEEDIAEFKSFAGEILKLYDLREKYLEYQEKLAKEICPNITHIAGPEIAAKFISHTGSLSKLAMLPASTIQVLGAEKALFKHLKNKKKVKPPKHGLLFQYPRISTSPKKVRGKIARALANKISLAAKADAFTKNFIAEKLKEDFEARYTEIMEQYKKGKK